MLQRLPCPSLSQPPYTLFAQIIISILDVVQGMKATSSKAADVSNLSGLVCAA